jgi:hypothetical protein
VRERRYTHGKERIDLKPELICIAASKDFEEGFQVRVAEEAITPQIVSIVIWVTSFREASSSQSNGEGIVFRASAPCRLSVVSAQAVQDGLS